MGPLFRIASCLVLAIFSAESVGDNHMLRREEVSEHRGAPGDTELEAVEQAERAAVAKPAVEKVAEVKPAEEEKKPAVEEAAVAKPAVEKVAEVKPAEEEQKPAVEKLAKEPTTKTNEMKSIPENEDEAAEAYRTVVGEEVDEAAPDDEEEKPGLKTKPSSEAAPDDEEEKPALKTKPSSEAAPDDEEEKPALKTKPSSVAAPDDVEEKPALKTKPLSTEKEKIDEAEEAGLLQSDAAAAAEDEENEAAELDQMLHAQRLRASSDATFAVHLSAEEEADIQQKEDDLELEIMRDSSSSSDDS